MATVLWINVLWHGLQNAFSVSHRPVCNPIHVRGDTLVIWFWSFCTAVRRDVSYCWNAVSMSGIVERFCKQRNGLLVFLQTLQYGYKLILLLGIRDVISVDNIKSSRHGAYSLPPVVKEQFSIQQSVFKKKCTFFHFCLRRVDVYRTT